MTQLEIDQQKQKVFGKNPSLELIASCRIDDGILQLNEIEKENYIQLFSKQNSPLTFFIPASGSGSRMFQFLFEYLEDPNEERRIQVEQFIDSLTDFAFFSDIPEHIQSSIIQKTIDSTQIIEFLLKNEGMNFASLPKGLMPFHKHGSNSLNPFQSQILQGGQLQSSNLSFHFTIQKKYESEIKNKIQQIEILSKSHYSISFSEQSVNTNSLAFISNGDLMLNLSGNVVTRPSGHGALLPILNGIEEELIFIKNIDNIQHLNRSSESQIAWKLIGGILLKFKTEASLIYSNPKLEDLNKLNKSYQVYSASEIEACRNDNQIRELLNRPIRVCGMVKNEGQPGGGPFWVNEKGIISKQIVEKAQISSDEDQIEILNQSTHFNPVIIAISPISFEGLKFDLEKFKDESKYFIVHKKQGGNDIRYMELPGLWNGSMSNWNTIFVELPLTTFSPVKTVMDLLGDAHKS